jgi:hypothetical protein
MRSDRIHFVATAIFALGFVLAGSGWSFVLSTMMNQRPSWSVCGQEMCSCLKPIDDEPACPLCEAGLMDLSEMTSDIASDCSSDESSQTPVKRVPKNNKSVEALGGAGSNVAIAFFVGTMIARSNADLGLDAQRVQIAITNDRVPWSRGVELPTPPPRG